MLYVKGVSWVSRNGKKRSNEHSKRYPLVYYYDESGHFHSKRVKWYEIPFYKAQICKQVRIFCTECQEKFDVLVKKNSVAVCPKCLS